MKQVLFVCTHNAGRSKMAEAFVNRLAADRGLSVRAESAGTMPAETVNPAAAAAMEEAGVPIENTRPRLLTDEIAEEADRIITMGCSVNVAACPALRYVCEDWHLDDPAGQPIETVRRIRDEVNSKVEALLAEWGAE